MWSASSKRCRCGSDATTPDDPPRRKGGGRHRRRRRPRPRDRDALAEEGARVGVADVDADRGEATAEAIRAHGGEAIMITTDVSDSAQVRSLVEQVERRFGRVDVMTANAGIVGPVGTPLAEMADDDFAEVMDVNFYGVVHAFKHAIPAIQRASGGALTATGSVTAHRGRARLDAYCASKHAILGLVRALAVDLGPAIRVNVASPGNMATEIGAGNRRPASASAPRAANPREAAYVHLFLVSDEGRFIDGQSIVADDGWTVSLPKY
jgi:NAD(P)-dependent dehydrogenase (short-subunit alcohol dehydrogenase family)